MKESKVPVRIRTHSGEGQVVLSGFFLHLIIFEKSYLEVGCLQMSNILKVKNKTTCSFLIGQTFCRIKKIYLPLSEK
jgi:hypothetical protein